MLQVRSPDGTVVGYLKIGDEQPALFRWKGKRKWILFTPKISAAIRRPR